MSPTSKHYKCNDVDIHCQQYAQVLTLLSHPHPQEFRTLAEAALDLIEIEGLDRVRTYLAQRESDVRS